MLTTVFRQGPLPVLLAGLLLASGCARETSEARRHEKWMAYSALPQEQREAVDQGQIRAGMSMDAVFIAWGKPTETLEVETDEGQATIWRFSGAPAGTSRPWTYRESRRGSQLILERTPGHDDHPRSQVRADIEFRKNRVTAWRTLPKPLK
jgi:hypothetical protein